MTVIAQPAKSSTLRVASDAPRERAIAAICASACDIGLAGLATGGGNYCDSLSGLAIEWQDAPTEIVSRHGLDASGRLTLIPSGTWA